MLLIAVIGGYGATAAAEVVVFDGTAKQGSPWSDNAGTTVSVVDQPAYPGDEENSDSIRIAYDSAYRSGGISFYGPDKITLPADHTRLRLAIFSGTHTAGLSEIRLNLGDHKIAFGSGSTRWTLDGAPGSVGDLTPDTWHELELDLSSDPAFKPDAGKLKGHLALVADRAGGDGLVIHLANVRFLTADEAGASPDEPASPEAPQPTEPNQSPPVADTPQAPPAPRKPTSASARPQSSDAPVGEPVTLTIHPESMQEITQWGIVTHNRPDWGKGYDITRYPASLEALYEDMGVTIVRFHIDYQTYDQVRAREILRDSILAVTDRGLAWYGLPWSPPVEFKTLNTPNGRLKGEINHLKEGYEDEVAAWLVELVQWLEKEGVPLPLAIGPQNEPDWPPPSYPGCIYSAEQIRTASIELRKALDASGYEQVKVVADDAGGPVARGFKADPNKGTINLMGLHQGEEFHTNPELRDAVDILATHTYDLHSGYYKAYPGFLKDFRDAMEGIDKELWMSEWETRHEHTFSDWDVITENIAHFNRDMSSLEFNGWIHWQTWKSWLLPDGPPETGEMIGRIRAGDTLVYQGIDLGDNPGHLDLRFGADSKNMVLELRVGSQDSSPLITEPLPQTPKGTVMTYRIVLPKVSGKQDLYMTFASQEHWREAWLNWFAFAEGPRIEAESFSSKDTKEKWSSAVMSAYDVNPRLVWVHDDGQTLHKRPVYYMFKKIWTNAPAGQGATVRRVSSSDNILLQGESKAARVESHRQDVSAFQHGEKTTFIVLNRKDVDRPVEIEGLRGRSVRMFRYDQSDAGAVNVDLHDLGSVAIQDGRIEELVLPAQSLSILVTEQESAEPN